MLLYMTISMKKYLINIIAAPAHEVLPDQVKDIIMKKLKIIKFGMSMLFAGDHHILHLAISLGTILTYAQDMLEYCKCYEDFKLIVDSMHSEMDGTIQPLDESKLSANQGEVFQFDVNYLKHITPSFLEDIKEIEGIEMPDLVNYQFPFNLNERYDAAFKSFKKTFQAIIEGVHIKLAQSRSQNLKKQSVALNENDLNKFEIQYYNVDFKKLKSSGN